MDQAAPSLAPRHIRPATAADAPRVATLVASAEDLRQVSPTERFPLDADTVLHWILSRKAGYVLEERGEVVAYAELVADADVADRYWIGHMIVSPRRRGLGLGRRLVATLLRIAEEEKDAREVGISAFEDNPRAIACYLSCGFRRVDTLMIHARTLVDMRYPIRKRRRTPTVTEQIGAVLIALTVAALLADESIETWLRASPWGVLPLIAPGLAVWWLRDVLAEVRDPLPKRIFRALLPVALGAFGIVALMLVIAMFTTTRAPVGALVRSWIHLVVVWSVLTVISAARTRGVTPPGRLPTNPAR